jgi:hypothetical protein
MSTITSLDAGDNGSVSRGVINTNFTNLNTDKLEKTGTDPVAITIADGANEVGLTITQNDATNDPAALKIVSHGSGYQNLIEAGPTLLLYKGADGADVIEGNSLYLGEDGGNDYMQLSVAGGVEIFSNTGIELRNDDGGIVHIGTDNLGGPSTLSSIGNTDLILQTGNATTGNITITDGANGAINLQPNGTGEAQVNGEQILTEALIKRVYKSADETLNNTITLQDDDHLTFAIGENEVWAFQMSVFYTAHSSADFAYTWSLPSGATLTAGNDDFPSNSLSGGNNYSFGGNTGTKMAAGLYGVVVNGVNAGSVTFRWAQLTLNASDITVHQGSHIIAHRLA